MAQVSCIVVDLPCQIGDQLYSLAQVLASKQYFFLKWAILGLFLFIFVFSIQLKINKCSINFADDWSRTADLWYQKRPLYQLSHNHFPAASLQFDWIVFYQTRTLGLLFCECIKAVSSFPIKLETSHTVILPPTVSVVCLLFTWERFH